MGLLITEPRFLITLTAEWYKYTIQLLFCLKTAYSRGGKTKERASTNSDTDLVTVEAQPERRISPNPADLHLFYVSVSRKEVPL